jgi:hypothetical protein
LFYYNELKGKGNDLNLELEGHIVHHYPHFFEEKMKEHNLELKEIESNAWKSTRSIAKPLKFTMLSGLLALIGLK